MNVYKLRELDEKIIDKYVSEFPAYYKEMELEDIANHIISTQIKIRNLPNNFKWLINTEGEGIVFQGKVKPLKIGECAIKNKDRIPAVNKLMPELVEQLDIEIFPPPDGTCDPSKHEIQINEISVPESVLVEKLTDVEIEELNGQVLKLCQFILEDLYNQSSDIFIHLAKRIENDLKRESVLDYFDKAESRFTKDGLLLKD